MDIVVVLLYLLGAVVIFCALVWSFVAIARENVALAVICLFLPCGLIAGLLVRVQRPWRPFALWVLGFAILFFALSLNRAGS